MSEGNKYLCFDLGNEEYAIPLLSIKEVIGIPEVTPIPQVPNYFLGIMNLRGQVISIMDLRLKFNIKNGTTEETSVIILDINGLNLGVVVDKVNSVQNIAVDKISQKPNLNSSMMNEYITGIYRSQNKLVLLLDIVQALSIEDRNLTKEQNKVA